MKQKAPLAEGKGLGESERPFLVLEMELRS